MQKLAHGYLSRRGFLATGVASVGGLLVAVSFADSSQAQTGTPSTQAVDGKGLCYSTIVNLGERWTKRPQLRTVLIIAAALGKAVVIKGTTKKPKLGVVAMAG